MNSTTIDNLIKGAETQLLLLKDVDGVLHEPNNFSKKGNPLKTFKYKGAVFVTGLFDAHSSYGIPLSVCLMECQTHKLIPCLGQFVTDATQSGWSREQAEKLVEDAKGDSGFTF